MTRYILSVDPGKATGIAFLSFQDDSEPVLEWSKEVQADEFAQAVREPLKAYGSAVEVVCERFTINAQTVKNSQAPYSLEQIGVLKQCLRDEGRSEEEIKFQSPADAKNMFPNASLKKVGAWHKGGEGHALDAIRHALLRLVKSGWKPLSLLKE